MSRGEVLSYLSADDLLQPHAVSRSVEQLLSSSAIAAVYSDFMLIGNASQAVRQVRVRDFAYYDLLVKGICQPGPGAFFRREAYEQAGGWDAALRQIPDFDFWLRVGLVGEIQRIPEVLSGFRVHEESQTYASPPADRCHEPVLVTTRCFERDDLPEGIAGYRSLAVSNACLTAAAMHWRGARYRESLGLLARACLLSPGSLLRPHAGHLLLHSLFSRTRHRLLSIRHRRRQFHTAPPTEPPDHQKHSAA